MTTPLAFTSLAHIDSHELSRLVNLWRLQALSGQDESHEIARLFTLEQRNRIQVKSAVQTASRKTRKSDSWWKFWRFSSKPSK
jgi:hypothetical protein